MSVKITQQQQGQIVIEGELNMQTVPEASKQLAELMAQPDGGTLVFDLAGVSRSDSAGVALLVEAMQIAKTQSRELSFNHLPQQMQAIARVSGLFDILPISGN
jgi:phospholipid transport system transporter-binding protein